MLAERAAGLRLPGELIPPLGLVTVIVIAGLLTMQSGTAKFATAACVAAAIAGFVLARHRLRAPKGRWLTGAAVAVFAVYAAPVVLSGHATFAGYIKLDDSATWMALTDRALAHGRSLAGLPFGTYEATLSYSLAEGYPLGSLLPWGVGRELVGQDLAWLFQPYLAFLAAMLALVVGSLIRPLFARAWIVALAAFVAAQPALLYAYSLWGGVKELVAAVCIALAAALVPSLLDAEGSGVRGIVPIATAAAATLVVLTIGGALWLVVVLPGALVLLGLRQPRRVTVVSAGAFAALGAVLALPALRTAHYILGQNGGFTEQPSATHSGGGASSAVDLAQALGNLIRPLRLAQVVGIWPAADFRTDPVNNAITYALIVVVGAAAVAGIVIAYRRGAHALLFYVGTAAVGCAVIVHYGSPWVDGKAMASASPVALVAAMATAGALFEQGRRAIAGVLGALIVAGVVWSNVLGYGGVSLGPRDQLHELQQIGRRIAGHGPTLMTEYQPYGVRHFLRNAAAEGASELRVRPVTLTNGETLPKAAYADLDQFQLGALLEYQTLVLRRSPVESRPPSAFKLVERGRWYEVWQRDPAAPQIVQHMGLGTPIEATGRASCPEVRKLATAAGAGGRLATVFRPPAIVTAVSTFAHPPSWTDTSGTDILPGSADSARGEVYVANPGSYQLWLGGSVRSHMSVLVDGHDIGGLRAQLNPNGQWTDVGGISLQAGKHSVELRYAGPDLAPGSAAPPAPLGPLALSLETSGDAVSYVPAADARSLCGKSLDWVEAVR